MNKHVQKLLIILMAFSASLLDVSFFSALSFRGGSIVSGYVIALILAITGRSQNLVLYVVALTIAFSIFSSVPIWLMFICFIFVPLLIIFLRKNYLPEPSLLVAVIYFIFSLAIFELFLMMQSDEFGYKAWEVLGYFVSVNTLFGVFIYSIVKRFKGEDKFPEVKI